MSAIFDGSTDALYMAVVSGNTEIGLRWGSASYTWVGWHKPASSVNNKTILSIYNATEARGRHLYLGAGTGYLTKAAVGANGTAVANATNAATLNAWNMAAGAFIYITGTDYDRKASSNGDAWGTTNTTNGAVSSADEEFLSIGARIDTGPVGAELYNGRLANVGIFSGVLSDSQIAALNALSGSVTWASLITAAGSAPIVWWDLYSDAKAYYDSAGVKTEFTEYNLSDLSGSSVTYDTSDRPFTITSGASAVAGISSVSPGTFLTAQASIIITGTDFGAVQGTVIISPTDDSTDVNAVTQTVTAWADTSITFTSLCSTLDLSTSLYLFVIPDTNDPNASGYVVQFTPLIALMGQAVF